MPQSLSNIVIHLIFSTKNRRPWLKKELLPEVHAYLSEVIRNQGCPVLIVGGVEDHVHILLSLSRTATVAKVVEVAKIASSKWLKTKGIPDFQWQNGYAAISIGRSEVDTVRRYVGNQLDHHRKSTFQEEYRALLKEAGILFDEKYVWD